MSARRRGRGHGGAGGHAARPAVGAASDSVGGATADELNAAVEAAADDEITTAEPAPTRAPSSERLAIPPRRPPRPARPQPVRQPAGATAGSAPAAGAADGGQPDTGNPAQQKATCTLAQMRRFIKSRPYVPVHELRRRFLIEGIEDEVSPVGANGGLVYVGLPEREAGFLGELIRNGEVGCELLLDPTSPGVIGVYPMRPVARQ